MTSERIRDPLADPLLTSQNSALVVIDYRSNQVQTVSSIDHELLVRTIISVARLAPAFDLPIVLSTVGVVVNNSSTSVDAVGGTSPEAHRVGLERIPQAGVQSIG